jgi:pimeloyl-ACP methyl ester carboxylesterase
MKNAHRGFIATGVVVIVSSILVFCLFFFLMLRLTLGHHAGNQDRRGKVRALLQRVYGAQEVSFSSFDGVTLAGLLIKHPRPKGTVVLCHGYKHSKELMGRYCSLFKNYNMMLFDFRGAGQSGGFFSSIGYYESEDVKAAIAFARSAVLQQEGQPFIVFGVSMGAAAALKAVSEGAVVDGLILDSPYASLAHIVDQSVQHFSAVPRPVITFLCSSLQVLLGPILTMNPLEYIKKITVPVLFIHASSDSITNPAHSVCLFRNLVRQRRAAASLWFSPPAKHAYSFVSYPRQYQDRVARFLQKVQSGFAL